jgi:hypothetical protein
VAAAARVAAAKQRLEGMQTKAAAAVAATAASASQEAAAVSLSQLLTNIGGVTARRINNESGSGGSGNEVELTIVGDDVGGDVCVHATLAVVVAANNKTGKMHTLTAATVVGVGVALSTGTQGSTDGARAAAASREALFDDILVAAIAAGDARMLVREVQSRGKFVCFDSFFCLLHSIALCARLPLVSHCLCHACLQLLLRRAHTLTMHSFIHSLCNVARLFTQPLPSPHASPPSRRCASAMAPPPSPPTPSSAPSPQNA